MTIHICSTPKIQQFVHDQVTCTLYAHARGPLIGSGSLTRVINFELLNHYNKLTKCFIIIENDRVCKTKAKFIGRLRRKFLQCYLSSMTYHTDLPFIFSDVGSDVNMQYTHPIYVFDTSVVRDMCNISRPLFHDVSIQRLMRTH